MYSRSYIPQLAPADEQTETYLPRPYADNHVMLVSHADDVFVVGGKSHACDGIFVRLELRHLLPFHHVPHPHCWKVTALDVNTEEKYF